MEYENNFILKKTKDLFESAKKTFSIVKKKILTAIKGELPQDIENPAQKQEECNPKTESQNAEDAAKNKTTHNTNAQESQAKFDAQKTDTSEKENPSNKADESQIGSEPCDSNSTNNEAWQENKNSDQKEKAYKTSPFKEAAFEMLLSILDLIASLAFIAAIVIAIKPSLLTGNFSKPLYNYFYFAEKIGDIFIRVEVMESNVSAQIQTLQRCLSGLGLIIFGTLKIIVLFAARNGTKKVISILTLAMTFLACFFVSEKFLLFLIFVVLLHIVFEYSCGFSTALVFIKLGLTIVISFALYIAVHFVIDESLAYKVAYIFNALRFPFPRLW